MEQNTGIHFHEFYDYNDMLLATKMGNVKFLNKDIKGLTQIQSAPVCIPDDCFKFLHQAAIIERHNILYASWYHCPEKELQGYAPLYVGCGHSTAEKHGQI